MKQDVRSLPVQIELQPFAAAIKGDNDEMGTRQVIHHIPAIKDVRIEVGFWGFYRNRVRDSVLPYQWKALMKSRVQSLHSVLKISAWPEEAAGHHGKEHGLHRGQAPLYFEEEEKARQSTRLWSRDVIRPPLANFQADKPIRDQEEIRGDAVRALYLLAGMADVAALQCQVPSHPQESALRFLLRAPPAPTACSFRRLW